MIVAIPLSLTAALCVTPAPGRASPVSFPVVSRVVSVDSSYRALWAAGEAFADFVAKADRRKEQWEGNYARGVAPDALVTRVRAAGAGWRLLVITVPGCSDSVNSIPYLASFVDRVPGLEMRLVDRGVGLPVMETHRTPDGRPATPTVILLDAAFEERGCWIERPAPLIAWLAEREGTLSASELFDGKMKWYDADAGASSLEELVLMIEAAGRGGHQCAAADSRRR